MDKEKVITIALGLLVGILLAGLYFAAAKFLPQFSTPKPTVVFNGPNTPPPTSINSSLTISQPADKSTSKDSPITVSGQAPAGAKIIIFAPAEEKIASADATGNFTTTIKLEEGENAISFSLLAATGKMETILRNVILEISPWKNHSFSA